MKYTIYVIDDDPNIRDGIVLALGDMYDISCFESAEHAFDAMQNKCPDMVLLDIGLPGMDGREALTRIQEDFPEMLVVMITGEEDIQTVIRTMKQGAADYIVKPLDMERLETTIGNMLKILKLKKEVEQLQEQYLQEHIPCFISESDAIQDVMEFISKVAQSPDTPILISGETGTGKELIAKAIHFRSPNFKGPFVPVNCAAIPGELIESELFGYEKGAFTGAKASGKKGLVQAAENGTLFLDEVGDLSMAAQAKLLRFLEEGEFYQVGGTENIKVKTRVVSATNKDLKKMIGTDKFREDLFFRLAVIKVEVPSLNERRDDILPIAKHFLLQVAEKFGKTFSGISKEAQEALLNHQWSGNVRELQNFIERAALVGKGTDITLNDLGIPRCGEKDDSGYDWKIAPLTQEGINLSEIQASLDKYYIQEALKLTDGNETKAAELLGLNYHTFRYRLDKYS
jgi:DNA-binding NtrC family response regulator